VLHDCPLLVNGVSNVDSISLQSVESNCFVVVVDDDDYGGGGGVSGGNDVKLVWIVKQFAVNIQYNLIN